MGSALWQRIRIASFSTFHQGAKLLTFHGEPTSIEGHCCAADSLLDALQRMSDSLHQGIYISVIKVAQEVCGSLINL